MTEKYLNLLFLITFILWAYRSPERGTDNVLGQQVHQQSLTAGEVLRRIQENVTCPWQTETVDTYKSGTHKSKVTGIATTFLATLDVLKRAHAQGLNMVVTHEPTYYNHRDEVDFFLSDPVFQSKRKFIEENNMVIFRFHDHWHRTVPDGIHQGVVEDLQWKQYQVSPDEMIFKFEEQTVGELAIFLRDHYQTPSIRVVGDPNMVFTGLGFAVGSPGSQAQIRILRRSEVEVLITGETLEWETVEWVRDANAQGDNKALILTGHANSEEAGMAYCAKWLSQFIAEIPVKFVPAGDPFWGPEK